MDLFNSLPSLPPLERWCLMSSLTAPSTVDLHPTKQLLSRHKHHSTPYPPSLTIHAETPDDDWSDLYSTSPQNSSIPSKNLSQADDPHRSHLLPTREEPHHCPLNACMPFDFDHSPPVIICFGNGKNKDSVHGECFLSDDACKTRPHGLTT